MAYDGTLKFDTAMDTSGFQKDTQKMDSTFKGMMAFKILEKGFQMVAASVGEAVARYDTLNRFPKVLENMGFSAEQSAKATKKLSDGIKGLPTTLDDVTKTTQRLTTMTGDLDKSVDTTLSLNNALMASGSVGADASRGMDMYINMLSSGQVTMMRWRSLQETMGYALQKTAEGMGFAGQSAQQDLYKALKSGEITFDDFNAKVIELNDGVGGFAEMAKANSAGIGTAFTNMNTAIVRGVTGVISAIDQGLSATPFISIQNVIESTGRVFESVLKGMATVCGVVARNIETVTAVVIALGVAWKGVALMSYVGQLGSLTAALKAMTPAIVANVAAIWKKVAAHTADTVANIKNAAAIVSKTIATKANTVAELRDTAILHGATGAKIAATVALKAVTAAQWLWNAAMAANPIGAIIAAVAALVTGIILLVKWLTKSSEEYQKQKDEVKALADVQDELKGSMKESEAAYEKTIASIEQSADTASDLVGELRAVSDVTGHATFKNKEMDKILGQLNSTVDGLNLAYDKENDKIMNLNTNQEITADQLDEIIKAKKDLALADAWQERANELEKEHNSILVEQRIIKGRIALIEQDDSLSKGEKKKLIKDLNKLLDEYGEAEKEAASNVEAASKAIKEIDTEKAETILQNYAMLDDATTSNGESIGELAEKWGVAVEDIAGYIAENDADLDEWATAQEEAWAAYEESVTEHSGNVINSFKKIPEEYEMSAQEMIETLRHNREKYAEWQEVMVEISGKVSAETLAELEKMGPGALSAINEMRANGEAGLREFDAEIVGIMNDSTGYVNQVWHEPKVTEAPSEGLDLAAGNIDQNTAVPDAVARNMQDACQAGEDVDFTPVGKSAMADVATAIEDGSRDVAKAVSNMGTSVDSTFKTISKQITSITKQMMVSVVSEVTNGATSVTAATTNLSTSIQTTFTDMSKQVQNSSREMMNAVNNAIIQAANTIITSTGNVANGVTTKFTGMISGAESITNAMMDGIAMAMDRKAPSLYAKADQIAKRIAETMAKALEVKSPSQVMIRLFEDVMMGIYEGMDRNSARLYMLADKLSQDIAARLDISPEMRELMQRNVNIMQNSITGRYNSTLTPQSATTLAVAGAGAGVKSVTNLVQNITTPKPLSASEMTREGQDMLRRAQWQLP